MYYLRLLGLFWSTAIAAELEYRLNFVIASGSAIINLAGSIFSLFLFYGNGYQFQGWNWAEALLVVGMFTFLQGCSTTFLVPNLNRIVRQIEDGTLDFVLLKPISSQFWLSTRMISPWGLPDLLFGLIILAYAGDRLSLPWTRYGAMLLPLGFGLVILYSLWFMLGAMSIWFVKIYNVTEVLRGFLEAGRFPMVAYPTMYRFFFSFVIPVVFLTTVPVEVLLGRWHWPWIAGGGCLAAGLFFAANRLWRFALRFYTSASS